MTEGEIRKALQGTVGDGLLIIVGCGLSKAEGLPGMPDLATHLLGAVPKAITPDLKGEWDGVACELNGGTDLESALLAAPPSEGLREAIVEATASCIRAAEETVITEVLQNGRQLRFASLLPQLLPSASGTTVVTTNYDRLLEVACEAGGLAVDSMFVGHSMARFNRKESRFSLCRGIQQKRKSVTLTYAQHVRILKPHGSLDWHMIDGHPVRCPFSLPCAPMIIPPGGTKYRDGYDQPFDAHRERANSEVDKAARYLIVGYGFNDDHLQTHLDRNLRDGKRCLLLTYSLTDRSKELLPQYPQTWAIHAADDDQGCAVLRFPDGKEHRFPVALWSIETFVKEILT